MRIWLANMVIFPCDIYIYNQQLTGLGRIWMCLKPVKLSPKLRRFWWDFFDWPVLFRGILWQTQMGISLNGTLPWCELSKRALCLPKCFVLAHQSAVNGFCCRCARFTSWFLSSFGPNFVTLQGFAMVFNGLAHAETMYGKYLQQPRFTPNSPMFRFDPGCVMFSVHSKPK